MSANRARSHLAIFDLLSFSCVQWCRGRATAKVGRLLINEAFYSFLISPRSPRVPMAFAICGSSACTFPVLLLILLTDLNVCLGTVHYHGGFITSS
jgi:hypothetical protein